MRRYFEISVVCVLVLFACDDEAPIGMDAATDAGSEARDGGSDAPCESAGDCDDGVFCNGEEVCLPASPEADARGCVEAPAPACLASQTCDEDADVCESDCAVNGDADGDSHDAILCGGDDCDDADANRFPGNVEVCDDTNHDEDCTATTYGRRDVDGDDEPDARCCNDDGGTLVCGSDCDDDRASVRPGASEVCNARDDDCNGAIDEGATVTLYRDADMDGFGDPLMSMMGCAGALDGYVEAGTDCDDTAGSINPSAVDTCDADLRDEDCSGDPNDPPGGCSCTGTETRACLAGGICATGVEMCIGGSFGSCSITPEPFEVCDNEDDDCNGVVDDGLRRTCWVDVDGDGYSLLAAESSSQCATPGGGCPVGYASRDPATSADCDDGASARSPGGTEICNGIDEDCQGGIDEGLTVPCFVDEDNDTYAAMATPLSNVCPSPARMSLGYCPIGYTNRAPSGPTSIDCNDAPGVGFDFSPVAAELCDGLDNDCDGTPDDGARITCFADADDDGYAPTGATSSEQCRDGSRPDRGNCPRFFTFRDPAVVADRDCADSDPSRYPNAVELCDAIDQDCDGSITDALMVACYVDADNDTYASPGVGSALVCPDASRATVGNCPNGTTNRAPTHTSPFSAANDDTDCADGDAARHPGVTEMCDEPTFVDANCNGSGDEGSVSCWTDNDNDGYATLGAAVAITSCIVTARNNATYLGCPMNFTGRDPSTAGSADCNDGSAGQRVIQICYFDDDRDGQRAASSSATNQCFTTGQGAGNCPFDYTGVTTYIDCCDTDANARFEQTAYFVAARTGCGGWDYNCSGGDQRRFTLNSNNAMCLGTTSSSCVNDVTEGWTTSGDPVCGASAGYNYGCEFEANDDPPPPGFCSLNRDLSRPQECR